MEPEGENFLEVTKVSELRNKIEQIDDACRNESGEKVVNLRTRQYAFANILVKVYHKEIYYLVHALTELGIAYLNMNYIPQAEEHLTEAFKLNEKESEGSDMKTKEYHIKICVKLAEVFLMKGEAEKALKISEKNLEENQKIYGKDHLSNVDIYYNIANANSRLENYQIAIDNFRIINTIYEKHFGADSDKSAKICLEMAQVYEAWKSYNDAIEYYINSYKIFEKIIKDNNYEIMYVISLKISSLYGSLGRHEDAFKILDNTNKEFDNKTLRTLKQIYSYQKNKIKYCMHMNDLQLLLTERLKLEKILRESGENQKALARECISIAYTYLEMKNKPK